MTDAAPPTGGYFAVNTIDGTSTAYFNGQAVANYGSIPAKPEPRQRSLKPTNPALFVGSKLKIERAKQHIQELEATIQGYYASEPYLIIRSTDPDTGEDVFSVTIDKGLPIGLSAIVGDAVHNLRAALDYVVCDLIRAHGTDRRGKKREARHGGFDIDRTAKRLEPGTVGKIQGVTARAERLILRLKASRGWNGAAWALHWLDIIDKHNMIVAVAGATTQITAQVGVPGMFVSPEGTICFGGGPPGSIPLMAPAGIPTRFRRIFPMDNNVELHRAPPGFHEEVQVAFQIAFFDTEVLEGEPIVETLSQMAEFVERTLGIIERHAA